MHLQILLQSLLVGDDLELMQPHQQDHGVEDQVQEVGLVCVWGGVLGGHQYEGDTAWGERRGGRG